MAGSIPYSSCLPLTSGRSLPSARNKQSERSNAQSHTDQENRLYRVGGVHAGGHHPTRLCLVRLASGKRHRSQFTLGVLWITGGPQALLCPTRGYGLLQAEIVRSQRTLERAGRPRLRCGVSHNGEAPLAGGEVGKALSSELVPDRGSKLWYGKFRSASRHFGPLPARVKRIAMLGS